MAAGTRHSRALLLVVVALAVVIALAVPAAQGADTPRRGGILLAVIGADPPSLDPHQESTFATLQLVAPLYSTLLQTDPYAYPKIIGDAASEWKISADALTYTFKIRQGIKFHDGSPLTSADVKATHDKLIFPPNETRSVRKGAYSAVASVEAPDPSTVVFKLKHPSASLLENLASPWNVIYPKKYLDKDPNHFMKNVVGSGPFKFKAYTPGASFEGERNPDYFVKDRPYLNGYKFYISTETSVRAAAVRSGRAYIEFRDLPSAEVDAIKKQLGDKVVVQQTPMTGQFGIAINNTVKPFSDVRVRKALTLGLDRYTGGRVLFGLTGLRDVGGLLRPGTEFAMSGRRPPEAAGVREGHGEEPGGGQAAHGRGGLPQWIQGRSEEPQREAPLSGLRGLRDSGVAEDRDRGRAPAARDRRLVRRRAGQRQFRADHRPDGRGQ